MKKKTDPEVSKAATVLAKLGGVARAKSLSAKRRKEIAQAAAKARWTDQEKPET